MNKKIEFIHKQPFQTKKGATLTMKALVSINGIQHIECYENKEKHFVNTISLLSFEEYEKNVVL